MATFTFNGISSDTYGLKIIEMPPPSRGGNTVESITIPGRPEQLNKIIEEYENTELEFEVMITDISKTRDIFKWLKGNGKLVYSDEPDKYYNVISNDVISATRISDELRSFVIRFVCSPFAYSITNDTVSYTFTDIKDSQPEKTTTVTVGGSYKCEPLYFFRWAGRIEITVNGCDPLYIDSGKENGVYTESAVHNGGGVLKYVCPESVIFIDTAARIAYKLENGAKKVCCEMTSGKFPMLEPGENTITFKIAAPDDWKHTTEDGRTLTYRYTEQNLSNFDITPNARWL